ncbi:L,D-transpeptidase [Lactobacillus corticis]|uniref:L,D-TPase catalytic domain-containing protein n=1 Tax=Lactobacillus corticis TaxID=2201249 RepID=A0A916VHG9_9LACO|nr:L,D-transpeptidase [Lactobacillus corticis]GFZ26627.1 hypothetical protein LCB40_05070 [Lactobacillus corticis]
MKRKNFAGFLAALILLIGSGVQVKAAEDNQATQSVNSSSVTTNTDATSSDVSSSSAVSSSSTSSSSTSSAASSSSKKTDNKSKTKKTKKTTKKKVVKKSKKSKKTSKKTSKKATKKTSKKSKKSSKKATKKTSKKSKKSSKKATKKTSKKSKKSSKKTSKKTSKKSKKTSKKSKKTVKRHKTKYQPYADPRDMRRSNYWNKYSEKKKYPNLRKVKHLNIRVSLLGNRVYVRSGKKVIYTMYSSAGRFVNGKSLTPTGNYRVQRERGSRFDYAKYYVSWKGHGVYLFHSTTTYYWSNTFNMTEARKLGKMPASHGCIRLTVKDAYWFYKHLPTGTPVYIRNR